MVGWGGGGAGDRETHLKAFSMSCLEPLHAIYITAVIYLKELYWTPSMLQLIGLYFGQSEFWLDLYDPSDANCTDISSCSGGILKGSSGADFAPGAWFDTPISIGIAGALCTVINNNAYQIQDADCNVSKDYLCQFACCKYCTTFIVSFFSF